MATQLQILKFHDPRLFQGSKTWKMLRYLCRFWRRWRNILLEDRDSETTDVESFWIMFGRFLGYGSTNHSVNMGLQWSTQQVSSSGNEAGRLLLRTRAPDLRSISGICCQCTAWSDNFLSDLHWQTWSFIEF